MSKVLNNFSIEEATKYLFVVKSSHSTRMCVTSCHPEWALTSLALKLECPAAHLTTACASDWLFIDAEWLAFIIIHLLDGSCHSVVQWLRLWTAINRSQVRLLATTYFWEATLGKFLTHMCLCHQASIIWYRPINE